MRVPDLNHTNAIIATLACLVVFFIVLLGLVETLQSGVAVPWLPFYEISKKWVQIFPSRAKAVEEIYPILAVLTVSLIVTIVWSRTKSVAFSVIAFALGVALAIYCFTLLAWRYVGF